MQGCGGKLPLRQGSVKDGKAESGLLNDLCEGCSISAVHRSLVNRLVLFTLLVAAGALGLALWRSAVADMVEISAESRLSMPGNGALPDHRFHVLSAWQAVEIPKSARFDFPMGTEHGGMVYNAQKFWEMNDKRGGHHFGDDLNGIGGMNTDLGDPVFSVADGVVLSAGEPSAGWGKLLVIGHRTLGGERLHSMYAHLDRIDVAVGALVSRGEKIGTVGTANGYYPAHLHFEMRASDGVDLGAGYSMVPLNRLDPAATLAAHRNAAADQLSDSPLVAWPASVAAPPSLLEERGGGVPRAVSPEAPQN